MTARRPEGLPTLLLVALLWSCGEGAPPGTAGPELQLGISPTPPTVGASRILVQVTDPAREPGEEARVVIEARRDDGEDRIREEAAPQEEGRYAVDPFPFPSPGEWHLRVEAELPDGRRGTLHRTIRVVGPPP